MSGVKGHHGAFRCTGECGRGLQVSFKLNLVDVFCVDVTSCGVQVFIFFGETFLSMNWAIVADILLVRNQ